MLSRKFKAEDLSPVVWSRLDIVLTPYKKKGKLFQLKEIEASAENLARIKKFYKEIEDPDFVHAYADIDEYEYAVYNKFAYIVLGKNEPPLLQSIIRSELKMITGIHNGTFILWISKDNTPFFHCIFRVKNDEIVLITTADHYEIENPSLEECYNKTRQKFSGPVMLYSCSLEEWEKHLC